MAVITLKVVVSSLDNVLATFNRIKVHRSMTGSVGPYTEVTTPTTRIPLETGKILYEYTDQAGETDYYYRVSYFHSTTLLESSLSDPQQGEGDSALDIMSIDELKSTYLFGVDLTKDDGEPFPDSMFEFYIKAAVSWIEHKLDLPIRPVSCEESHDYDPQAYMSWVFLKLNKFPIISVENLEFITPSGDTATVIDSSWIRVQKEMGHLNVLPNGSAGITFIGASGSLYPRFGGSRFIPDFFRVKYTAGFESGKVPDDIRHLIGMVSSYGPLNIAGDLIAGAGIASQSLGIDGLSQSVSTTSSATNSGYGSRILSYTREAKDMIPTLRKYYKGIGLTIV